MDQASESYLTSKNADRSSNANPATYTINDNAVLASSEFGVHPPVKQLEAQLATSSMMRQNERQLKAASGDGFRSTFGSGAIIDSNGKLLRHNYEKVLRRKKPSIT